MLATIGFPGHAGRPRTLLQASERSAPLRAAVRERPVRGGRHPQDFAAVEQAAVLAGAQGHLTLLAVTAEGGPGANRSAAISPQHAERLLERASRIAMNAGVPCETVIDPAGPAPAVVLERAGEHDLLALGAPWASWLGAILFDGVAEAALQSFSTPMLAARATAGGPQRFAQRILVASDGLDGSDELVELAARVAKARDGHVTLVHVAGVVAHARPHRIEAQGEKLRAALAGTTARCASRWGLRMRRSCASPARQRARWR